MQYTILIATSMILLGCTSNKNKFIHSEVINEKIEKVNYERTLELNKFINSKSIWILENYDLFNDCLPCEIKLSSVLFLDLTNRNPQIIEFSSNEYSNFYIGNLKSDKLYSTNKKIDSNLLGTFEIKNKIISISIKNKQFHYQYYKKLKPSGIKNEIQLNDFLLDTFCKMFKRKTDLEIEDILKEKVLKIECNNDLNEVNLITSEKSNWIIKFKGDSLQIYKINLPKVKKINPYLNEKLVFECLWKIGK